MYIPTHFREDRPEILHEIIRRYSFATLVSQNEGSIIATQLPFLFDADRQVLRSHMARPNPQWKELEEREVMVIFQGPHAYISPNWYETKLAVPTWNYVTVHAYGTATLVDESALRAIVTETVRQYESGRERPWQMSSLTEEYVAKLLKGIVGFEIALNRLEGKLKLGQNRSAVDIKGTIAGLESAGEPMGRELNEWMRHLRDSATTSKL